MTFQSILRMQSNAKMVEESHEVLNALDHLESFVKDAETGTRGFFLTGEAEYLAHFEAATQNINRLVQELSARTAENDRQPSGINSLQELIDQKPIVLKAIIQQRRKKGMDNAGETVKTDICDQIMDAIRRQISEIRASQDQLLDRRNLATVQAYETALWTALISTLTGLSLVAAVFFSVQYSRKKTEAVAAVLLVERERLQVTLASIGDGVIACDRNLKITFLNPVSEHLTGWTNAEAIGKSLETVLHIVDEDTHQTVENLAARALREGAIVGLANHTLLITKQGGGVPIDDSASPIRDAKGNITGVVLVFRDVTERRREEGRLHESSEFTRSIVDTLGELVVVLDRDMKVLHVNRAFSNTFQIADDRILGRSIYQLDGGQWNLPILHSLLDDTLSQSTPASHVEIEQHLTQIGRKVLRMTASRFAAGSERREAVLLVMSDVTEERILEEANRRQDQQMRWFLEQIKDYAIFTMDADCRATSWNQGVKEVLGFDEDEFIGHDIRKLIFTTEAQAEGIPETEFTLAALDQRASDDRWMMRKGGEHFWASGITTSIRDNHDHLIGYSKVMRDLTSRKRAQDELAEIAARLSEMDRRKDEFLATLAHELRNPLAPIKNAVQLMGMLKLDPELVELRQMMARQVEQLVRLIDDLLDVSRISRGKIALRKEVIELKIVIDAAVESSATFIAESRQQLTIRIDDNTPIFVNADPSRLTQVVSNLLNNSAKYSDAGCRIELSVSLENHVAVICVSDNGIGIAADRLADIFQMFAQVDDSPERGSPGLGIGLTLVKTLVELHDGTVIAESEGVGKGSLFTVRLPATEAPGPQHSPPSNEHESKPVRRFRVLVVEDMRALREMMARLLSKLGHEVEFVENGALALQKLSQRLPEVVFSDIAMPGMTGYELAQQIRQRPDSSSIYLVALTGFGQSADREKALQAGFDEHMVKPVDIVVLKALFEKLSKRSKPNNRTLPRGG